MKDRKPPEWVPAKAIKMDDDGADSGAYERPDAWAQKDVKDLVFGKVLFSRLVPENKAGHQEPEDGEDAKTSYRHSLL